MSEDPRPDYISLRDAAKYSGCYSQEYLSLRARQGKLKGVKIARNWLTTKEWIDEYLERVKGKRIGASDRGEDKKIEDQLEKEKYISLKQAAKFCSYSQDYLSLRARQGKLKAVKFGRNWVTKKEWINEYLKKVQDLKNRKFVSQPVPQVKLLVIVVALIFILIFILASLGSVFGYSNLEPTGKMFLIG